MSIFGAGGGTGKGASGARRIKEAKDNLDSTAYVKIIELLSEGEIEGFATPSKLDLTPGSAAFMNASMKDVFFNKTPLLRTGASNDDPQEADFNFQDVSFAYRLGTQDQDYMPGFDAVESEQSVNAIVAEDLPVTRTITNPDVDAVRITLSVPVLQKIQDDGDIRGSKIDLKIETDYNGAGFNTEITDTIAGRTADLYQRDYIVTLSGEFPVDIRVTRLTPDSTSVRLSNDLTWFSYTELIYQKLRYPNTAYVALRLDAEQFSNVPTRSYRIRGVKVRIPSNATVDKQTGRLIYNGVWNGTFAAAVWTSDPAWILWDLITSTRYGLGDHIQAEKLDKWAFYRASQYCNELVPTGLNSQATEPRFSCNVNIQTQEEAYKLIGDMCSVFRAMPFWNAGALTVAQDRPADPVARFNLGNVTEEGFTYEGSSLKGRATVVIVSWLNLELADIDREVVENPEAIARYGVITKEVSAFACTSRSQAHRIGEWLLYTENYETEVVAFSAGIENGTILRPGSIIEIADPVKSGLRRGGRISSATTTEVTVDSNTGLASVGSQALLSVMLPNGISESRAVSSIADNVITVSSPFSEVPQTHAPWLLDDEEVRPTQWRVLAVQEDDGINYTVTAVSHDSSKYAFIERGAPLEARPISILNQPPPSPIGLDSEEIFYVINGRVATKLALSWQPVRGVNEYKVRWRGDFTNWAEAKVYGPIYEIEDVADGSYQIEVYAISATQIVSSAPAELTVEVQGVSAPPVDPTGVSLVPVDESSAIIQWDLATDLDVLIGGEVLIRHDPRALPTAEWATSNAIVQAAAGSQTQKQVPLLEGTYFIAFRDQSGNRSVNPVAIPAVLPTPQPRLLVKTWAEENETPEFNGDSINLGYDSGQGGLFLDPSVDLAGQYIYEETLDLSAVYDVNLRRRIVGFPVLASGLLFDDAEGLFDNYSGDFDGGNLDLTNAITYVRTTDGDPATAQITILLETGDQLLAEDSSLLLEEASPSGSAAVWGSWNEYANAIVRGRGIQLKVIAQARAASAGMIITELGATAELQQRSESGGNSGASGYDVVFDSPFYQTPDIIVSPSNMASGDYYVVTSASRTGFRVDFKNSANAAVTRSFSYTAVGYGREI